MRCELPDLKRCCFCVPLRRGLIAWGYIKAVLIFCIMIPLSLSTYLMLVWGGYVEPTLVTAWLLLVADFGFNISFLIAAHTKNFKLFRIYYYYVMVSTVTVCLFILIILALSIADSFNRRYSHVTEDLILGLTLAFVNLAVQLYIMMLVRSEIRKLADNSHFEFINNETQSQVKSHIEMAEVDA